MNKIKTIYWVVCDYPGCEEGTPDFDTLAEAKHYARIADFFVRKGFALCPDHRTIGKPNEKGKDHANAS